MRRTVEAVLVVNSHNHPHVLVLQAPAPPPSRAPAAFLAKEPSKQACWWPPSSLCCCSFSERCASTESCRWAGGFGLFQAARGQNQAGGGGS